MIYNLEKTCESLGLDLEVMASMIWQESGGNPYAMRYEPGFYAKYLAPHTETTLPAYTKRNIPTFNTELRLRAFSFGLMQIMGQTARETGFQSPFLSTLFLPEINIVWGCRYFKKLLDSKKNDYPSAIARYNGHGDAANEYAKKILLHVRNKNYLKLKNVS